jgi:hypothetical protein
MALLGLAFKLFGGLGTIGKLVTVLAIVGALAATYGIWHHNVWSKGYARAIADIAAQDKKAIDAAKGARNAYFDCVNRDGMRWQQSTGECVRR